MLKTFIANWCRIPLVKKIAMNIERIKMSKKVVLFFALGLSTTMNAQPYAVGHTQITYTDPARAGRSIQTEIYYPAATAGEQVFLC